ncbi:purine nucleoside phosphorylase YfiH [Alteromonas sp. D210916BOD_24]|uniref:peptidoglycan editing factor PgeF n=1 Tax=Alteromonas sp. D210916BOD_24 TaxID=3157618 RepID=UPI00399D4BC8
MSLRLITPQWSCPDNVVAYTSTRKGGVSLGDFEGLNVGAHVGDNLSLVETNRQQLPHSEKIVWLEQVHGNRVVNLPTLHLKADASYSNSKAYFCAVMTADCVPVLLCDTKGTEVAAVHAGWKGLDNQIILHAIEQFDCKPCNIMAWIGPAICAKCYEVDAKVAGVFKNYTGAVSPGPEPEKFLLDLPLIAALQLTQAGVGSITQSHLCTYCQNELFYSHRRATHQNKKSTGRIVSVIGLL